MMMQARARNADPEEPPPAAYRRGRSPFKAAPRDPLHERLLPVSARIPQYRMSDARRDLLAGLTVAALALPSGMAYAEVAGLSPINGLYALLLPAVLFALLGSSRQLIVGPEGAIAALTGAALVPLAAAGTAEATALAAMLALLVGACFLLAWLMRLGWLADYFSRPVLVGYIHGITIVLICAQLGKLLGVEIDATEPIPQAVEAAGDLGGASGVTVLVSAISLLVLFTARAFLPRLPAALLVVVGFVVASYALDLEADGVAVVGAIPAGLPSLSIPDQDAGDVASLIPAAIGIFLVTFADGILTARTFAGKHNQDVRANQELLAFSGMSAAAGVTQGFPLGASGARTTVNDQMGARTQLAGLMAAGVIALVLLFLTEPMSYLPSPVLGAVIVVAAMGLVDREAWRGLRMVSPFEFWIAAVTLAGVAVLGVLEALAIAVALSIVDVVRRSARPHDAVLGWVDRLGRYANVQLHASARVTPGVVVYRLDDRLFFANARYVKGRVREALRGAPQPARWLVFDAEAVAHVDATGAGALADLAKALRRDGVRLVVARVKPQVRELLAAGGVVDEIGERAFYPTVRAAVAACLESDETQTSGG